MLCALHRPPDEADAQALRAAVLLDELPPPARAPAGAIVVEAKASGALRLMQSTCSRRVLAVPTTALAAFRCPLLLSVRGTRSHLQLCKAAGLWAG